jgi:hypothetical protein
MTARIIDGRALANRVRARIADDVARLTAEHGVVPGLAAVLVGDDPASQTYVGMKHRATEAAGMRSQQHLLPADTSQADLLALIDRLNVDETVDGILVQLPLPDALDAREVQRRVAPEKDVDALNPYTAGPAGERRAELPRLHARRGPRAARRGRRRVRRRGHRDRRTLHARRPSAVHHADAQGSGRDGHARALAHAGPRRGVPSRGRRRSLRPGSPA